MRPKFITFTRCVETLRRSLFVICTGVFRVIIAEKPHYSTVTCLRSRDEKVTKSRAESSEFSGSLFLSPFSSFRLHFPANGKQVTAVSEMAFDSLKQPEISTSRLSRLSFHFQEPERSTVETGRLVFAAAGSVQREDDDRCGVYISLPIGS